MTEWRQIPGFSRYEASEHGRIRRHVAKRFNGGGNRKKPGGLLKPITNKGYIVYSLRSDNGSDHVWPVSRFVAEAFIGPRPSSRHGALHKDDDRTNNHYKNLYWGTDKENVADRVRNGHNRQALTDDQWEIAKARHALGCPKNKLARLFKVNGSTIDRYFNPKSKWYRP